MGCCVSTPTTTTTTPSENRAPPDEETVKEVLSETPKWIPSSTIAKFDPPQHPPPQKQNPLFQDPIKIDKLLPLPLKKTEDDIIISEEVSEVCSITESMISAVTTTTDRRDNDDYDDIRHRVNASPAKMRKNRSFSGGRRDMTVGKSPSKRSEQSPARRNFGSVRLIQGRDQPGLRNEPRRRDSGENSCRRSRSPATRINNNGATRSIVGRSPSARRTNQSPARVRTVTAENDVRRKEHSSTEQKRPSAAANESLENPLVSLECFIFL